jgi:hypothetical protein
VQEAISASLDSETTGIKERATMRHLSECESCRAFQQAWQTPTSELVRLTRDARLGPVISPPSGLLELAVGEGRRKTHRPPSPLPPRFRPTLSGAGRGLIAGIPAAVALVCLHTGLAHPPHKAQTPPVSHCTNRPADLWVSPEIIASR